MCTFSNKTWLSILAVSTSLYLFSLPQESDVVSGSFHLQSIAPNHLEIKTSHQTILNWKEFSIGPKETVQFIQPSSTSSVLNRVKGTDPSHILGRLSANGKVYLINPNGIVFGKNAVIQAADFLASTHDCSNVAFLEGKELLFNGNSKEALINLGAIQALEGNVILLARLIENEGTITAPNGSVLLGAGQEILLKLEGTPLLTIRPFFEKDGKIDHKGRIEALTTDLKAEGQAYARGINIEGTILALNTVEENGKVYLTSEGIGLSPSSEINAKKGCIAMESKGQEIYLEGKVIAEEGSVVIQNRNASLDHLGLIDVSGPKGGIVHIDVSEFIHAGRILGEGREKEGGKVEIFTSGPVIETSKASISVNANTEAGSISLQSNTSLFSSGTHSAQGKLEGGTIVFLSPSLTLVGAECNTSSSTLAGQIFIGGGPHGQTQELPNAKTTHLSGNTKLLANGGDGGMIVVFSEGTTICHGTISANGGQEGGNGGWIEVSGKEALYCGASLDASAEGGAAGQVLLDPKNIVIDAVNGLYPQYQFINPNPSKGGVFGESVFVLSTGNVVITNSQEDSNKGAVYLFNGETAEPISYLRGSSSDDFVGSFIQTLTGNGNYVVLSSNWGNAGAANAGAATWCSGTTGMEGVVSAINSLVGTQTSDEVGLDGLVALANGNYIIKSSVWNNGGNTSAGAITWGDGTTGVTGAVSSSNSLVGTQQNDLIGYRISSLTNGNYVALSPFWDDGAVQDVGAVTWQEGTLPITGTISAANSLIGTTAFDRVGNGFIATLTNGNYVVGSPDWNNGATAQVGAATWCNGNTGLTGPVSPSNSLIGSAPFELLSTNGIGALANGNYVVSSHKWNSSRGAATWGDGTTGVTGTISSANSLVGTQANDKAGFGIGALQNGHYVVFSPFWANGGLANAGALTWGNGTIGVTGAVSSANSLVGTTALDLIANSGILTLNNGNYVVKTVNWHNGGLANAGALTWGNGTTGVTGAISSSNSLVGTQANTFVGNSIALENGNYLALTPDWNSGLGAATWGNGTIGLTGTITTTNSLVGTQAGDAVGYPTLACALTNGNYVVSSLTWQNGVVAGAGAATWGNGSVGTTGVVSPLNSVVGTQVGDFISELGVVPLNNGNYVILSPDWSSGKGAVTWGNGSIGTTGIVSSVNSLVGTQANDLVGVDGVVALSDGNYLVGSSIWANGGLSQAGAMTFANGTVGTTGAVSSQNSLVGQSASTSMQYPIEDAVNGTFLGQFLNEDGGLVRVGLETLSQINFSRGEAQTMTLLPSTLTDTLNLGTPIVLQANNDIEIISPITANSGAGDLTLSAGRTISLNANITTGNGSLIVTANDLLSSGVVDAERDTGAADLIVGNGVTIDTGTGNLTLSLLDGTGKTNSTSGDVIIGDNATLQASSSGQITITAEENTIQIGDGALLQTVNGDLNLTAGKNIIANNVATLRTTGAGELFLIVDNLFPTAPLFGNGFATLPLAALSTNGGRLLIYTSQRALNTMPATINLVPFVSGPEFVDSATEKWGTYYPNSSGIPFTIFYKEDNSLPPSPPVPSSASNAVLQALLIGVANPFQSWMNPWYQDAFFAVDSYPPYLTPKFGHLVTPSLLRSKNNELISWSQRELKD